MGIAPSLPASPDASSSWPGLPGSAPVREIQRRRSPAWRLAPRAWPIPRPPDTGADDDSACAVARAAAWGPSSRTSRVGHGGIESQIADGDVAELSIHGIPLRRRRRGVGHTRPQEPVIVRRIHHDRIPRGLDMPGDAGLLMEDLIVRAGFLHAHRGAHIVDRHGVARRRNRDQRVGRHLSEPHPFVAIGRALAHWRERLVREPINGSLMRRPMETDIGHGACPFFQPGIQRVPRPEAPAGQGVALHIFDAALHFALGLGAIRSTRARRKAVGPRKIFKHRLPEYVPLTPPEDQRPRIIVETLQGHAAEVPKRAFMTVTQHVQPLMGIRAAPQAPTVAEREDEEMDHFTALADPDVRLAKIDLALLPWRGLKPHGRECLPVPAIPQRLNRPLHLLIATRESQTLYFTMQHHAVPADLRSTLHQKWPKRIELPTACPRLPRLPGAQVAPPFDGVAIDAQLARNRFHPVPALHTR